MMEQILVINKIHLNTCRLDTGNLDEQRMIGIVDRQVHARQTNYIMQLMAALVDLTELRHERTRLEPACLTYLRQDTIEQANRSLFLKKRTDLLAHI